MSDGPAQQAHADGAGAGVDADGYANLAGLLDLGTVMAQLQQAVVDGLGKGGVLLQIQAEAGGQGILIQVDLLPLQMAKKQLPHLGQRLLPPLGNAIGDQPGILISNEGLYPQQGSGRRSRPADAPSVAEVLQIVGSKENTPGRGQGPQRVHRCRQIEARIPEADRLPHEQALKHCGQGGIYHLYFSCGKFLPQLRCRVQRGLEGAAELGVEADTQDGQALGRQRTKRVQIILQGRHGGLGEHPGPVSHHLVELVGGDVPLLPVVNSTG